MAVGCGKAFLCGEYAVLAGYGAVVLPVPCLLKVEKDEPGVGISESVPHDLREIFSAYGVDLSHVSIDASAFFRNGEKVGIGSSAATVVALCRRAMREDATDEARFLRASDAWFSVKDCEVLKMATEIHKKWQGGGSGADVVCSYVRRAVEVRDANAEMRMRLFPADALSYAVLYSGHSAPTAPFLAAQKSRDCAESLRAIGLHSETIIDALRRGEEEKALRLLDACDILLAEHGRIIQKTIVTPEHLYLKEKCKKYGIFCKVSGAGGGDISLVLARDDEELDRFLRSGDAAPFKSIFVRRKGGQNDGEKR